MPNLPEVISSPVQQTGEMWSRAQDILEQDPKLLVIPDGNHGYYLSTESVRPGNEVAYRYPDDPNDIYTQEFALAVHVPKSRTFPFSMLHRDKQLPKEINAGSLKLIVNRNYSNPTLLFQPHLNTLMETSQLDEVNDTSNYLPAILDSLSAAAQRHSEDEERRKSRAHNKTVHRATRVGEVISGLLIVTGIGLKVNNHYDVRADHHREALEKKKAAKAAVVAQRVAFDQSGVTVPLKGAIKGTTAIVQIDKSFINDQYIPSAVDNDTFAHPRRVDLLYDCQYITNINPETETLRMVSDGGNDTVVASVDTKGDTFACEPTIYAEINSDTLVVQVVKKG